MIPQAICSRYGLMVGAYSAWFVRLLMTLTMPISWPIAKLLDLLLGSEHSVRSRGECAEDIPSGEDEPCWGRRWPGGSRRGLAPRGGRNCPP